MEDSEKEEIRNRTDIVELISGYTSLKRRAASTRGSVRFTLRKPRRSMSIPARALALFRRLRHRRRYLQLHRTARRT